MIKPDAVGQAGAIKSKIKSAGFKIVAQRKYTLTPAQVSCSSFVSTSRLPAAASEAEL